MFWEIFIFSTMKGEKIKMKQKNDPIDELKLYLTLQLEAHLNQDERTYQELEEKIQKIEKNI